MQREANAMQRVSVNEWFGEAERVFDQLDPRLVFRQDDFDDIEAEENVGIIEHAQPGERAARDAAGVARCGWFRRDGRSLRSSAFSLPRKQASRDRGKRYRSRRPCGRGSCDRGFCSPSRRRRRRASFSPRAPRWRCAGRSRPRTMFQPLEKHSSLALSHRARESEERLRDRLKRAAMNRARPMSMQSASRCGAVP